MKHEKQENQPFFDDSRDLVRAILVAIPVTLIGWVALIFIFAAFGN